MNYINRIAAADHVREIVALGNAYRVRFAQAEVYSNDVLARLDSAILRELADLVLICAPDGDPVFCESEVSLFLSAMECLVAIDAADVGHAVNPGSDRDARVSSELERIASMALSHLISTRPHDELVGLFAERLAKFRDVPVDRTRGFLRGVVP